MLNITEIVKHISKFLGVEFLITKETMEQNFNSIPYWNATNFKMSKKSIFHVALKNNFNNEEVNKILLKQGRLFKYYLGKFDDLKN